MKVHGSDALLLSRHCTWHTHMHLDSRTYSVKNSSFFFFERESLRGYLYSVCVYVGSHCERNVTESVDSQETWTPRTALCGDAVVASACGAEDVGWTCYILERGDRDPVPQLLLLLRDLEEQGSPAGSYNTTVFFLTGVENWKEEG